MLKRFGSIAIALAMTFTLLIPGLHASASGNSNKVKVLQLSNTNNLPSYDNLSINTKDKKYFRNNFKDIANSYETVLISYNYLSELDSKDIDNINQLIDNGVSVSIYGDNIQIIKIKKLMNDYIDNIDEKIQSDSTVKITLVSVSNINGQRVYTKVIDASDTIFTDSYGNQSKASEISTKEGKATIYKHDPIKFVKDVINDNKELLVSKVKKDEPENIVTPQLPPSPSASPTVNKFDYSDLATVTTSVYPYKVYVASSPHYWDFVDSSTVSPKSGRYVDNYTIGLNANFSSEDLIDWTYMPSNTYSASISLSTNGTGGTSYSVSTQEQKISHAAITKGMSWNSVITPNQAIYYPGYTPNLGPYKLEPGIRVSNTAGGMAGYVTHKLCIASTMTGVRYTSSQYSNFFYYTDF